MGVSSFSPNLKPAGSSKGLSTYAVGELAAVSVPVVVPVADELLQHKRTVPLILVKGVLLGIN